MLFSSLTGTLALLLLSSVGRFTLTSASPTSSRQQAVVAANTDLPALKPIANLTNGLGLLTFQVDNFRRSDSHAAVQEILDGIDDAQKLATTPLLTQYEALRTEDVSMAPEVTAAARKLGDQLRALFAAIDNRRTVQTSKSADGQDPSVTIVAPADAGVVPQQQAPAGGGDDGIIEEIYNGAVGLLSTIQDSLPEYFWILAAAT